MMEAKSAPFHACVRPFAPELALCTSARTSRQTGRFLVVGAVQSYPFWFLLLTTPRVSHEVLEVWVRDSLRGEVL
jgi:hypothetical protein